MEKYRNSEKFRLRKVRIIPKSSHTCSKEDPNFTHNFFLPSGHKVFVERCWVSFPYFEICKKKSSQKRTFFFIFPILQGL